VNPPIFQIGRKIKWRSALAKNCHSWLIIDIVNVNNHWTYVLDDGHPDRVRIDDKKSPTIYQFELANGVEHMLNIL
jgi:hypothetical protein